MAAKVNQLRELIDGAGRKQEEVTISFTAPVMFTSTPSSSRPLLQGEPEQVAEDLRKYQALGVTNFNMNLPPETISEKQEMMERFVSEVVPLLD